MKYVDKDFQSQAVVDLDAELRLNQLDEASLTNPATHPTLDGPAVYDQVRSFDSFHALKQQMYDDQGGICCYCGKKLEYPNHPLLAQYIVEHVKPKEADRTLAGEYKNLLLSCRPTDEEEQLRKDAPRKEKNAFFHCDKAKGSMPITYSPLQTDCGTHFCYDEFGDVNVANSNDAAAVQDLITLNLKCHWLKTRRAAAIEGELFDENYELLPEDELRDRLTSIMQRDANGNFTEFCFVIKGAIEHVLA